MKQKSEPRSIRPLLLFVASRVGLGELIAIFAAAAVTVLLTPREYHSPFAEWEYAQDFAPLAPAVLALAVGLLFSNRMSNLERVIPQRQLRTVRACWAICILMVSGSAIILVMPLTETPWRLPLLRNAISWSALALLGSVAVGARLAWIAVLVPMLVVVLVGRDLDTARVMEWTLPLHPASSLSAGLATAALALTSVLFYAVWDTKPSRGFIDE